MTITNSEKMIKMPKATYRKQGILLLILCVAGGSVRLYDYLIYPHDHSIWSFVFDMVMTLALIGVAIGFICRKPEEIAKREEDEE